MNANLKSIKKELSRLTDTKYLKKEINRITAEVKKFDVGRTLNSQARERIEQIETRFRKLLQSLQDLQKQVDANLEHLMKSVRGSSAPQKKTSKKSAGKTSKKTAGKSSAASRGQGAKKTSKKSAPKSSGKSKKTTSKK